jgi:hypothetical protein
MNINKIIRTTILEFIDSNKSQISVDDEFEKIKLSRWEYNPYIQQYTLEDIVNNWETIKNIDDDNIDTIKFFVENPKEMSCLIFDDKGLADGYHRIIALKLLGIKQFCAIYDPNFIG